MELSKSGNARPNSSFVTGGKLCKKSKTGHQLPGEATVAKPKTEQKGTSFPLSIEIYSITNRKSRLWGCLEQAVSHFVKVPGSESPRPDYHVFGSIGGNGEGRGRGEREAKKACPQFADGTPKNAGKESGHANVASSLDFTVVHTMLETCEQK